MTLPRASRERLVEPLAAALVVDAETDRPHSLPLADRVWVGYKAGLFETLDELGAIVMESPSGSETYDELRAYVAAVLGAHQRYVQKLDSIRPFEVSHLYFVTRLTDVERDLIRYARQAVLGTAGAPPDTSPAAALYHSWPPGADADADVLQRTFEVETELLDEVGEFVAGRVLAAFAYRTTDLMSVLFPHLRSVGLPVGHDLLAAIETLGRIVGSPDPVVAYVSAATYMNSLLAAPRGVASSEQHHFATRDSRTRQSRRKIAVALTRASSNVDGETRAIELAGAFRAVAEGPVRQYGWAIRCLQTGRWSPPPMLNTLRDALVSHGGLVGSVAGTCLLIDLRNGEAHEDLSWDGVREHYLAGQTVVHPAAVRDALLVGVSFGMGCEAARIAYSSIHVQPGVAPPTADEPNRTPSWSRALAYFGTNRLSVVRADLNAKVATVVVADLRVQDVNPCFQALVCAHRLFPEVEVFRVLSSLDADLRIAVGAEALDRTDTIWTGALDLFDMMPLSTFLPANLDARLECEQPSVAARSVSWIAVDDALGSIDGGPPRIDEAGVQLLRSRLRLANEALSACVPMLDVAFRARPLAVLADLHELFGHIDDAEVPLDVRLLETLTCLRRLRHYWAAWGPVPRHPNIIGPDEGRPEVYRPPAFRPPDIDPRWRTF